MQRQANPGGSSGFGDFGPRAATQAQVADGRTTIRTLLPQAIARIAGHNPEIGRILTAVSQSGRDAATARVISSGRSPFDVGLNVRTMSFDLQLTMDPRGNAVASFTGPPDAEGPPQNRRYDMIVNIHPTPTTGLSVDVLVESLLHEGIHMLLFMDRHTAASGFPNANARVSAALPAFERLRVAAMRSPLYDLTVGRLRLAISQHSTDVPAPTGSVVATRADQQMELYLEEKLTHTVGAGAVGHSVDNPTLASMVIRDYLPRAEVREADLDPLVRDIAPYLRQVYDEIDSTNSATLGGGAAGR